MTVAGLTIYDMLKSMDRAMALSVYARRSGQSDAFSAGVRVVAEPILLKVGHEEGKVIFFASSRAPGLGRPSTS